ncbi:ABC transporter permease [Microvirga sp. W0021]|uniref:ABC transporter permease n=1 Tax=Hohaiivirga grylli TaxID=3133970 RepID=A0ABV0BHP0_9HYPH
MSNNKKAPVSFRGGLLIPRWQRGVGAISLILLIALWQVCSSLGWISPIAAPSPAEIFKALGDMIQTGEIYGHLAASLGRLFGGFAIGGSIGILTGLAIGLWSPARAPGVTIVATLFPIPKIALLPLFIIWFGIGEASKLVTIAFGTFFPMVVATYGAVDNVDRSLIRMGRSFGLSTSAIIRKIVLPGALPGILSGLRISTSIGIVLLVAAEMINADQGIGGLVLASGNLYQTDRLLAGVFILCLIGLIVNSLIDLAEKRLLGWRS